MKYGSVCSGIESANVAWEPLGWSAEWFSEVEAFPSAVLAHHWPNVANLGDMCALPALLRAGLIPAPEILVGGTPCQAFSVAGMRKGLDDERGQLTIKYVEVANEIDKQRPRGSECITVWENVPGVLSSRDNAFGCFLAALVGEDDPLEPAGKRWTNAGIVYGPQRVAAWRILDAQYFGVAQRRRRVFVVASARDGFDPGAVLFESEGLRRDTPPSREEGETAAGNAGGGAKGAGRWPADIACTLNANFGDKQGLEDQHINGGAPLFVPATEHTYVTSPDGSAKRKDISPTVDARAKDGPRRNQGGVVVVHGSQDPLVLEDKALPLGRNGGRENVVVETQYGEEIAGTLTARHDSSPCPDRGMNVLAMRTANTSANGIGVDEELAYTLDGAQGQAVVQGITIHGTDKTVKVASYTDIAGSLRTKPPGSVENSSTTAVLQKVAQGTDLYNGVITGDVAATMGTPGSSINASGPTVLSGMRVRRLTPVECERLQDFPDDHTRIAWRKKPPEECPDGPRYKAIGNSKAVPVIQWVGIRLKNYLEEVSSNE